MTEATAARRFIWFFGQGQADGGEEVRHLVGGKGASLAEMTRAMLNVPPGFTISAECCDLWYQAGKKWPDGLEEEVRTNLERLEQLAGRPFARGDNPLLVAVRSGAAQSMPGMMDTVLNVGLNPDCVRAMAQRTGQPRAAWEAYRHFMFMFGHTVAGIEENVFADLIAGMLHEVHKQAEDELDAKQMEELCGRLLSAFRLHTGHGMPMDPWEMLRDAINAVFGSWNNERAITYRQHHRIDGLLGTAVNVQMMCPSEVSGVMFTANPVNSKLEQVLIESSYGLGEAIVLGKVTPDRFVLDKHTLQITDRVIADKRHVIATLAADGQGQTGPRDLASLSDAQVLDLARLGLRVEGYFRHPCDIEWALSQGQFYLLQARAIKTPTAAPDQSLSRLAVSRTSSFPPEERERVRQEEITALKSKAEATGTVWSRYNLAEVLPEPTPMTWSIVRRFMSGQGGFGLMYRDLGFDPDPALDHECVYDLICGRLYCNLSREPRMQFSQMPFEHPFAALKASPRKAMYPVPVLNPSRGGWRFWLKLPLITYRLVNSARKLRELSQTFAERLRAEILPAFDQETSQAAREDLTTLSMEHLGQRLEHWIRRTLYDYARDSLKPTVLAALALANLERGLLPSLGPERTRVAVGELSMGARPDPSADLPNAIQALAARTLGREEFLKQFGHRGSHEMELAQPRWSEAPELLDRMVAQEKGPPHPPDRPHPSEPGDTWKRIAEEARIVGPRKDVLRTEVDRLHGYLGMRETAKHYLMKGYAIIRRLLIELGRRHRLDGGIFWLTLDELPRLTAGDNLSGVIQERRHRRDVALSLEMPQVLFSDDLEAIGRPAEISGADQLQGVPLSAGIGEGLALVLLEPAEAESAAEPYVLVCPTTDPAWVPLFVHARGLVMETGGVLSHGAIVAREFGLPAVAGIPDVHRRLKTGQRLRVDGGTGKVTVLS